MYKMYETIEDSLPMLIVENLQKTSVLKISLNEGGRIKELTINNQQIINDIDGFDYEVSYASSILFPFVSRLQNGSYHFSNTNYQFEKNDNNTNALHGLVYNKSFQLVSKEIKEDTCSMSLNYTEKNKPSGFPFYYSITITYTLSNNELELNVCIENKDSNSFPFTIGWHPYFLSNDLQNSALKFKSDKKVIFDEDLITKEIVTHTSDDNFSLKDKQLDDCFFLKNNKVAFSTPKYNILITSSAKENYLQLYTPKDKPIIAIEPMTGISNSFNNKIGLQVLEPNKTYSITWNLMCNPKT